MRIIITTNLFSLLYDILVVGKMFLFAWKNKIKKKTFACLVIWAWTFFVYDKTQHNTVDPVQWEDPIRLKSSDFFFAGTTTL